MDYTAHSNDSFKNRYRPTRTTDVDIVSYSHRCNKKIGEGRNVTKVALANYRYRLNNISPLDFTR